MKQGWEIKRLGEVCTFCSGYTPKESELLECGAVPYFKVSDMNHCDNLKYLTHTSLFLEYGCKVYPKHTIVFPKNGAAIATNKKRILAQDSVVDLNTGGVVANDALIYFEYLYLYFLNLDFRLHTRRGAVPTLDIAELKNKTIPVPPREKQERIVAELDCLSGVIERKREQLRELDALAQSIFYQMFGDPITNEKGWEVKTIGDVCKLKSGDSSANNTSEGLLPYIKVGDMNMSENIPYITTSSTLVSREENIKGIFPIGTTIFPKRGGAIFTNKKRLTTVEICCDLNTMGVIPMQEVLPLYIFHFFIQIDFGELCNGAAIPQINNIDIAPLKICVPPLTLQQEFADKIEAIEKQKELIKKSISETENLFNARMDYYFN